WYAKAHGFTIVTFDADFYDLSLLNGHPPKIVWLRTGNLTTAEFATCLAANGEKIAAFVDEPEQACLEIDAAG
ncbi:MAG: DUF5615 family PIN-like protein, partial [Verrucomicrobiales bacterium]|nr:DUF5615 family PIN-like protein [Verrucomicrobiales bacterium]